MKIIPHERTQRADPSEARVSASNNNDANVEGQMPDVVNNKITDVFCLFYDQKMHFRINNL